MNSRERMLAAYNFQTPDKAAVEYYYSSVGYYEHGEKINDLYAAYPGDLEPYNRHPIPVLGPELFDQDGRYYEVKKDEWGTTWEYRIFGIQGKEKIYPLDDWAKLDTYQFPVQPNWVTDPRAFDAMAAQVRQHQKTHFYRYGWFSFFERMIALRPFEDVLCDLATDDPDLIRMMDLLTDYYEKQIQALIRLGVDCIRFADDFGTQTNLIFSPEIFRTHFKPRYERLMKPIRDAGIKIMFHSCGMVEPLFPEFADLGVSAIWPQIPVYDMQHLADTLRDMRIALAIHTDRAHTVTRGTPEDIRALVKREFEIFRPDKGGSWFYLEVDNGMPFENVQALVEAVYSYR